MTVVQQLSLAVSERWMPLAATILAVALAAVVLPSLQRYVQLAAIPLVGGQHGGPAKRRHAYMTAGADLYREGYRRFKDGVFKITTSGKSTVIVIAPQFLDELRKLPDDVVSFSAAISEGLETKYTKIATDVPVVPAVIKAQLTPALPRLNAMIANEVAEAMALEMPPAHDWTEIDMNRILMRVVAMVSGRVFVGPELSRDPVYIEAAINYTLDIMAARSAVLELRPWLRPLLANRLPVVRKLQQRIEDAEAFLRPVVERRRQGAKDPAYEKPNDVLQWLLDSNDKGAKSYGNMAQAQLGLTFAAIHTTTLTALNAFYDVAASPGLAAEVRDDIREALAESHGAFTSPALQAMKKLDSVLKETMRLHPPGWASFQRKVLKTFTLSNGQVIPAGVIIEMPAVAINSDTSLYPNAAEFDGLRFYNLRHKAKQDGHAEAAATNQFVSVSQNSLTFGYGRHACPGRFFAANEIKMIVAQCLLKYDIRLSDGAHERYPKIEYAGMSIPDTSKRLMCRLSTD